MITQEQVKKSSLIHPSLKIYNKRADTYDITNSMMESIISRGKNIFYSLKGKILEVGTGTGTNLQYYNPGAEIIGLDWSPNMVKYAKQKVKELHLKNVKEIVVGDVQKLEEYFPAHSFNFVTSRCVFCSVPDPIKGLKQISKVLKPTGKFIQLEHGLSKSRTLNLVLKIFDPIISKRFGLHLNRDHIKNLKDANFKIVHQWLIEPTGVFKLIISKMK